MTAPIKPAPGPSAGASCETSGETSGETPDARLALLASGVAGFSWDGADGLVRLDGATEALFGAPAPMALLWPDFLALFAEPDREALAALPDAAALADGVQVVLARRADPRGRTRRLRVRASNHGTARGLAGVIAPAFGAAGERPEGGRLEMELALLSAVERDDFEAWLQPIVSLSDFTVVGFEALVRWECPGRGLLQPDDFMPLADELNLVGAIGAWMREAAAAWSARHALGRFVAVNIASRELQDEALAHHVADVMARHGLGESALKLEVTEGEIIDAPEAAERVLLALKQAGVGLALDDFGAGHSSFARLGRFAFDTVKIDRYFVRTLASKPSRVIVESIVKLAHDLGMTVVAEGVETSAQADAVRELGCDFAQGYVFAPPMPASEAQDLFHLPCGAPSGRPGSQGFEAGGATTGRDAGGQGDAV